MTRIHTNIPALQAIHRLQSSHRDLATSLVRLATGLRINRGADDPAGLIASELLRREMRGIQQAIENSTRASNVISVAEAGLNEVSALLLDLQALIVEAANEGALIQQEIDANQLQIDSILASLDRISNTTAFAGRKLLDGSQAYLTSAVPGAVFLSVELFSVRLPEGGTREVRVEVTQSAQTAGISFIGSNASGPSTTSATTIEIRGTLGSELLSFASGTTLGQIRTAINNTALTTGVSAVVSAVGGGGVASALLLNSIEVGSGEFVSVAPAGGNFIVSGNENTTVRDTGVDPGVLINGQAALVRNLQADVRSGGLDARFLMTQLFAQTLSSATFSITGGGSLFQIGPEVTPNGQIHVGFNSVSTTHLGSPVTGFLFTLQSGRENDVASGNFSIAQQIVAEAIDEVSFYRGRLGNIQKSQIDPNISAQRITLENVTASESTIRDADIGVEVSRLTRAQILVQTAQTALQIANSIPNMVLSLLG